MKVNLMDGVNLQVVNTQKFDTTTLVINLISPWEVTESASRGVLSRIMGSANADYPDQQSFTNRLAWLNGADLDTDVFRYGNTHVLRIRMEIPNNKMLANDQLLKMTIDFMASILFKPLVNGYEFNKDLFDVERNNLARYLESIKDDKELYAYRRSLELYYSGQYSLAQSDVGSLADVESLTAQKVYQTYLELLNKAQIQITVLGNVNKDIVKMEFSKWPFKQRSRQSLSLKIFDDRQRMNVDSEKQPIQQTKLSLGYSLPIYYDDELFLAAVLFNQILGGSTQSRLFQIVRERYHLAYYADSSYNSLMGTVFIQAGVNNEQLEQAEKLIQKQILEIQAGQITDETLTDVKNELLNAKLSNQDVPQRMAISLFNQELLGQMDSFSDWCTKLKRVTKQQIVNVANDMNLRSKFILLGE